MTAEIQTASGILIPTPGHGLRAWVKMRGEPAQVLYETPHEFMERYRAFQLQVAGWDANRSVGLPPVLVCHDFAYGQAMFFLPESVGEIAYVGVTYPTTEQGRTTPGSVWAGQCRCGEFGGPCGG